MFLILYIYFFFNLKQNKTSFYATFLCGRYNVSKKKFPLKHEKTASKIAHNQPNFFPVMPTGPNPAQFSIPVPQKSPTEGLLYSDF